MKAKKSTLFFSLSPVEAISKAIVLNYWEVWFLRQLGNGFEAFIY